MEANLILVVGSSFSSLVNIADVALCLVKGKIDSKYEETHAVTSIVTE